MSWKIGQDKYFDWLTLSPIAFGAAGEIATPVTPAAPLPIASGAPGSVAANIANGGSLSGAIDLGEQRLHRIAMPATWTAAAITFQASVDGVTWNDLYDRDGEVTLSSSVVGASRSIVVDPAVFFGIRHLKVRSGTSAAAVPQGAARALTLATVAR